MSRSRTEESIDPAPAPRASASRRLIASPWLWAGVLLAGALPWYLVGEGLELVPFLLGLIGGWLCGLGFVNATFRMPSRRGAIVHVVGAVVAGAVLWFSTQIWPDVAPAMPEGLRSVAFLVQMASIPAAGWIWLGLISRITALARRPAREAPVPPGWEEDYDGSIVRFSAVPMRLRTLTLQIVALVAVGGVVCTVLLIAFDDVAMSLGPRILVIVLGAAVALPLYGLLRLRNSRHTVDCSVAFGAKRMRVTAADSTLELEYDHVAELTWVTGTDYARVDVVGVGAGDAARQSLVVGVARQSPGVAPGLPSLSRRIVRTLEAAGLSPVPQRRTGTSVYRRIPHAPAPRG
ncbi:hypothetical protein SCB71_20310 [Herbiconiux sp. KACC 21604]|uniref:hypothetical protein n=1 Tax=unclassified Herbiconiux TaxID=2618217 RepID=UPI001492D35B|nr:hypothetical protein [Herbiconiux sp. SALV-R1]QJU55369.1 hypothetical protein HL652_18235 [Herbiconiux sp. SALV-R1]WPO86540.1 hypothetical protein SCB71_20310 [Herbiconiux sp. KACC 21604]